MLSISFSLDVVMVPCQERQLDSLMQKLVVRFDVKDLDVIEHESISIYNTGKIIFMYWAVLLLYG